MKFKIFNLFNFYILLTILAGWYVTASVIQPFLHYSFQQIGFYTGSEFLKSYSSYPGGSADYLAVFISQFFRFNSFGSFLIVAVASVQGLIALKIVKSMAGNIKLLYSVFTVIILFAILVLNDYHYPYYASVRLLLAYVFVWLFSLINTKSDKRGILAWPVLACLLFYLAGGSALFVFALSTAFILLITNKTRIFFLAIPSLLIISGLLPYLGYKFWFQITLRNIYDITMVKPPVQLEYTQSIPLYIYYSLLPVIILGVLFLKKLPEKKIAEKGKRKQISPKIGILKNLWFIVSMQIIVFAVGGYILITKLADPLEKQIITMEYYAENEQWPEILRLSQEIKIYDFRVNFQVNRAYSHLGVLPDQLFNYPQLLGVNGLFDDPETIIGDSGLPTSDLYFDLGFMSESQHWAFEAQTLLPYSPRILKRLVMINLVNRKYNLADKFLKVLNENMLYHDWVRKYSEYVSDTIMASNDKVIAEKRRFTPHKAVMDSGILNGLKLLVETNPDNRMAYDYLLSYCILDINYNDFIEYLQYYKRFKLKYLPRSWEEMLSIYIIRNRTMPAFITSEIISEQCRERIANFNKIIQQYNGDIQSARSLLRSGFKDTYWYYSLFLNPKVTNAQKNKTKVR